MKYYNDISGKYHARKLEIKINKIIRCETCGMSYDFEQYNECPYCIIPDESVKRIMIWLYNNTEYKCKDCGWIGTYSDIPKSNLCPSCRTDGNFEEI